MQAVFKLVLQMSITASYVIAAVIVLRLLMKKLPRKFSYYMWYAVLFRLCCPFSIKSAISIFNLSLRKGDSVIMDLSTVPVSPASMQETASGAIDVGVAEITEAVNQTLSPSSAAPAGISPVITPPSNAVGVSPVPAVSAAETAGIDPVAVLTAVWLIGIAVLAVCALVSYLRLKKSVRFSAPLDSLLYKNVRQADIGSSFLLGLIRPTIYVPFSLTGKTLELVLTHERYHLKRRDNWVRALSYCLLCVHWMNPLCWLAYYLMIKDMEISCDEFVLSGDADIRKIYSSALLNAAANKGFNIFYTVSFGGVNVKERIKNVMSYKKGRRTVSVIAAVLCIVLLAAFTLNGKPAASANDPGSDEPTHSSGSSSISTTDYVRIPSAGKGYEPGVMQRAGQGLSNCVVTDDRIYHLSRMTLVDSGVLRYNVQYLDLSSGQQVSLCNKPDCKHDSISCNSFVERGKEDSGVLIYYAKEDSILLLSAASGNLYEMDKDGVGARILLNIGPSYSFFYYDEDSFQTLDSKLYVQITELKPYNEREWVILEIDLEEKTFKTIFKIGPNQRVCGGTDSCLILEQMVASGDHKTNGRAFFPGGQMKYDLLDVNTGEIKGSHTFKLPLIRCMHGINVMSMTWDQDHFVTHIYDACTGEERSAAVIDPPQILLEEPNQSDKCSGMCFAVDDTHFILCYMEFQKDESGNYINDRFGRPDMLRTRWCIVDAENGTVTDYTADEKLMPINVDKYAETDSLLYYSKTVDICMQNLYAVKKADLINGIFDPVLIK